MKNINYIILMGIASGLLLFATLSTYTTAGDNLKQPVESIQELSNQVSINPVTQEDLKEEQLEALGSFKFKLSEAQLKELDCFDKPPGYQIILTIDGDKYFFECP